MDSREAHKRRTAITALPLHYSGLLMKRSTTEKDFLSYYGELRGATLFLYQEESQDIYTEKFDLEQLTSVDFCCPDKRKSATIITLSLQQEEDVLLKLDNPDTEEEWRGYILTMVNKEIPSDLRLLPGQMLLLTEALQSERGPDPPTLPPPPPPPRPLPPPRPSFLPSSPSSQSPPPAEDHPENITPDMPGCFFDVTRQEAETMLDRNPECGAIILRPSSRRNNYALTLRLPTPSGAVMKNYRVSCTHPGFVIELHSSVTVSSLNEVVNYFVERTKKLPLRPYVTSQPCNCIVTSPAPCGISFSSHTCETVPRTPLVPTVQLQTQDRPAYLNLHLEEGEFPQDSEI